MLPTGFSPGYTSPSLLNRRERQQQQQQRPSLPAEVMFGARIQKVSAQDDAVKKHLAKEAKEKLAEKKSDWKHSKDQLEAREPGLQNHISRLNLAVARVERELARETLSEEERTQLNNQKTAFETERKEWLAQLAKMTAAADKAEREYQAAQRKADELAQVHGETDEEKRKAEEKKEKEAQVKREEKALEKSGVVVNNYLSGEAGKKTEGATEVKSATDAAKTDSKADSKVGGKSPRADFITQRVEDESNRIALDLDYYFGHENLKTNSTLQTVEGGIGRIPLVGSRITGSLTNNIARASRLKNNTKSAVASEIAKKIPYGDKLLKSIKPEKKVAPEVEGAARKIREQLEKVLKERAGIYADMAGSKLQEEGKDPKEFNPTDCHGQGVKAKDYADVVLHNAAIDIAREAMDYPEDKAKHAEYQKRRSEKLEAQYMTSQMKWGLGVAALGGAYMMGVPFAASIVALPFRVASFLPVPGLRDLAGWTADVIKANSEGVAGKVLGGPLRMLTAGGTTLMGGTILGEGGWNLTKKHLNVKELSQVPEAVTNRIDNWAKNHKNARVARILARGPIATARVAKSIAGKLWNSPETIQSTAKSVDGKLANKPSQLAKKAQDTVSSWISGSSEKVAAPKVAGKITEAEKKPLLTTGSKSNAIEPFTPKPAPAATPPKRKRSESDIHQAEASESAAKRAKTENQVNVANTTAKANQGNETKQTTSKSVGMVDRVMGSKLTTVAGAGLVAGGLATALALPVIGLPAAVVALAGGIVLVYQGLQKMGL